MLNVTVYRGGPILSSAVAGIDQALWDIAGKARGVPVHELIGGAVRDRVRVYSWIGGDEPSDVAAAATEQMAAGFTAVKMNASPALGFLDTPATVDAVIDRVAAVREAIGRDRDIAVDFHGRVSLAMARRILPKLEPFGILFAEEPVVPELSFQLRDLVTCSPVPIATGERLYSRWDFRAVLEAGVAVVQPDLSHAGGISEVRRIAAAAETCGAALAPHCPLGPIALAASLQVSFAVPNLLIQEQSLGIHYNVSVPTCSTTSSTRACSRTPTATSGGRPHRASVSRSMQPRSRKQQKSVTGGAIHSGGCPTAPSRNGDLSTSASDVLYF